MKIDRIPGGLAKGKTVEDLVKRYSKKDTPTEITRQHIQKELRKGLSIEQEHTTDPAFAREIAMDHLWEDLEYYKKLTSIEMKESTLPQQLQKINNVLGSATKLAEGQKDILLKLKQVMESRMRSTNEAVLGTISTDDENKAQALVKKGLNVKLVKKTSTPIATTLEEVEGITFSKEETANIAKEVGKSLVTALRSSGEELSKMLIKKLEANSFSLQTTFKEGEVKDYQFYIDKDKLHIQDNSFDKELIEVGVKPSGEAIVNRDVLKNELLKHFQSLNEISTMPMDKIVDLVFEAYYEVLKEAENTPALPDMSAEDPLAPETGAVLQDTTEEVLEKFPTLKHILEKLMTKDFSEFVDSIDWISPRPTAFRVNIKNGQDFDLKWMGKGFEAQIKGKKYYLDKVDEYQQALDKLGILFKEAPLSPEAEDLGGFGEKPESKPSPTSFGGGGGSSAPPAGTEEAPTGFEEPGAETPAGEEAPTAAPKNLGGEEINFEEPEEEPKA